MPDIDVLSWFLAIGCILGGVLFLFALAAIWVDGQ